MSNGKTKILLVEDNPGDARLIREMLAESENTGFEIDWVPLLSAGLEKLDRDEVDLVLLDLGLPDSRGLETFVKAYARAPQVPFVVLTGLDDETMALSAVREGAQDYLVKGQTDGAVLLRALRYATERKKIEEDLRRTRDDLAQANHDLRQEIEERRAAELAVDAERQRLFGLLDGLPATVYVKAPDFSMRFANRIFQEIYGEWQGKCCFEVIHSRTEPCADCPSLNILKNGAARYLEVSHPDSRRFFQIHSYPFTDVDGSQLVLTMGIDISKRKQVEEALKESERKYRLLVSAIPAVVFKGYADWSIEFFDDKIEELTGYRREEFNSPGLKWSDLILEEDLVDAKEAFVKALKDDGAYVREYRIRKKDGQVGWIQARGRIVFRPDSKIDHVSGVFYDVSERKAAEEALRISEARLGEAQRIAKLGRWEWDIQKNESIWSEEIFRSLGLPPQPKGPSLEGYLNYIHPDDREPVKRAVAEALAGKPYSIDIRYLRSDGVVRYIHVDGEVTFDDSGRPIRMVGTNQDITERRKAEMLLRDSEARFRAIYQAAAMGIGLTDMRGRFLTVNKTFQEMLDYGEDEIPGKTCLDFTHADDIDKSRELFREMDSGQRDRFQMEKRFRRKGGQYFWARVTVSSVKDPEGRSLYTIGMVEDITKAKQAEERLQESEKSLRFLASQLLTAQEDERKRISRELHDELGQALLVLKLQARVIKKGLGPEYRELHRECQEILDNLDKVVDNVRRLSRDLSPTILEDLGLSAALRRLIRDFRKHFTIEFSAQEANIDDLFPLKAQVAIFRIFQESLTNIGKHSQASQLTVSINKTDDQVSFLIQDNGRGFDPDRRRTQTLDHGMGLAAMEERARMVGGVLNIWSQEGSGTKISLDIPYSPKTNNKL